MKTVNVNDLCNDQLNYAVVLAKFDNDHKLAITAFKFGFNFYDWNEVGRIIFTEGISVNRYDDDCEDVTEDNRWYAMPKNGWNFADKFAEASNPIEAVLRCYVQSKLGETVEIPDEL